MPRWITSLGPKKTMIGLFQNINMTKNSITGEDLYIMVNSVHRPSRRKYRQKRHAPSTHALPSLRVFLYKESQQYPSSPTRINSVSIWSGMECWDVFSLPGLHNKEKRWDIILRQSRFPLEYVKGHVQSLLKGSEVDQYVVQNLTWSGVYLRST